MWKVEAENVFLDNITEEPVSPFPPARAAFC